MFRTNSPIINTIIVVIFLLGSLALIRFVFHIFGTLLSLIFPFALIAGLVYLAFGRKNNRYRRY